MLELADKDTKEVVIIVFRVFEKLNRDMEDIKMTPIECLGIKYMMSKIFLKNYWIQLMSDYTLQKKEIVNLKTQQ